MMGLEPTTFCMARSGRLPPRSACAQSPGSARRGGGVVGVAGQAKAIAHGSESLWRALAVHVAGSRLNI
jgi:hypothetical protein